MVTVTFDVSTVTPSNEPSSGEWTALTDRLVQPVTTRIGRGNGTAKFALANDDGDLDPTPARPRLMEHGRILFDTLPGFRGYITGWVPAWRFGRSVIEVTVSDAWQALSLQDADLDLTRQRTHTRIGALLDVAGWPAGRRNIADGVVTVDVYEQESASIRRVLDDTADAEDGELWIDREGTVRFRSRHARLNNTVDMVVIGSDVDDDGQLAAEGFRTTYGTEELANVARIELADSTVWEVDDQASRDRYGDRVVPVRDLPIPGYEAQALAGWIVYRYAEPSLAVSQLTLLTDSAPAAVLGLQVGSLIEFRHRPPSGQLVTLLGHVEHIVDGAETGRLTTTFDLSPYFGAGPWGEWADDLASEGAWWLSDEATSGPRWAP